MCVFASAASKLVNKQETPNQNFVQKCRHESIELIFSESQSCLTDSCQLLMLQQEKNTHNTFTCGGGQLEGCRVTEARCGLPPLISQWSVWGQPRRSEVWGNPGRGEQRPLPREHTPCRRMHGLRGITSENKPASPLLKCKYRRKNLQALTPESHDSVHTHIVLLQLMDSVRRRGCASP